MSMMILTLTLLVYRALPILGGLGFCESCTPVMILLPMEILCITIKSKVVHYPYVVCQLSFKVKFGRGCRLFWVGDGGRHRSPDLVGTG